MEIVPVLDFGLLSSKSGLLQVDKCWIEMSKEVRKATGEIGFMELINHGIPQELVSGFIDESSVHGM
jgi:isopenicillin N synthase-like dioxygenase